MDFPYTLHHGVVSGVIGTCHQLLMDAANSLLVECGLFQRAVTSSYGKVGTGRLVIDFFLDGIEALVDTHVHIDHEGSFPHLLAAGFKGSIICSEPSAKLLSIVLEDAFKLGVCGDQKQVQQYLKLLEKRIVALPYKHWFSLVDTPALCTRIRLQRAGHILGWAFIEIELHYPATGLKNRIVSSGYLVAPYAPILPAPKVPYKADVLLIESTCGDRLHENRRTCRQRLETILEYSLSNQGKVLIPAFSIGRIQELLYELGDIIHRKVLKAPLPLWGRGWGEGIGRPRE
ncbi:MBL fold metallo-hydrolase [uncultured Pseudomonas sp.]|uniref:MBL fold metallo-hydrolase n=1 Tax=uncultured Pseudomonas sp. TaxID=114707 RepID=UPI0030DB4746|tara:strand:+ start:775 stop:1638 length:864 start_codon:yes stop_codon:yes gene_type:complete